MLLAHVRDPVPDASEIAPSLPLAVDAVLARGLAKDPATRPATAADLVEELRHALGSARLRPTVSGAAIPAAAAARGGRGRRPLAAPPSGGSPTAPDGVAPTGPPRRSATPPGAARSP